jgi:hypothetical protein
MQVKLRCRCGEAQGCLDLSSRLSMHVVCYCNDCRAFMYALDRADLLDDSGGSELFVTTPSRLTLTWGIERLCCLRLSDGGMLRWHWSCCNTPLANTMPSPGVPFVSIHRAFIDLNDTQSLRQTTHVQARYATGSPPPNAEPSQSLSTIAKIMTLLFIGRLQGAHRQNPLFVDGIPVVTPRVLSVRERNALRTSEIKGNLNF